MGTRSWFSLGSALACALGLAPGAARADVQHTVARGHTIQAIARRYHVTERAIIEKNHVKDPKRLRVGDVLTIPNVDPPAGARAKAATRGAADKDRNKDRKTARPAESKTATYAERAKTPGVVHLRRLGTRETRDVRIADEHGRVASSTLETFEKLLRSPSGASHEVDARLVSVLGVVSNHFGSRPIEIVSGFRPFAPTQYTAHSHHNQGRAIDFRIVGVPNDVVHAYCRTMRNVGCGYYPNNAFVHIDVRESNAFWVDYAKPGEPPHYNAPNVDADEGASDVHDDEQRASAAAAETSGDRSGGTPADDAPAERE